MSRLEIMYMIETITEKSIRVTLAMGTMILLITIIVIIPRYIPKIVFHIF